MAARIEDDEGVTRILREVQAVAVLGAHHDPKRPAAYVPAYLAAHGYRVIGVNPRLAGRELFGAPVVASLAELPHAVDVVDVFRRSADVPAHLPEILAMDPPPRVVWLQRGIRHDEVADALVAAGIDVVQDRCMLADHRRLVG